MPNTVESLRNIEKDCGRLFALAAGLRYVFHNSHQLMSGGVRGTEAELFGYQHAQFLKMVSQPALYETLKDFRRGGQEANGPEVVRSRRIVTRLRYHDHCGYLPFRGEVGHSETGVEQVDQEKFSPFRKTLVCGIRDAV